MNDLDAPILFIGVDVNLFWDKIVEVIGHNAFRAPLHDDLPRASAAIHLASMENLPNVEEVHHFIPQYKRIAEAEANWLKEQKEKAHE